MLKLLQGNPWMLKDFFKKKKSCHKLERIVLHQDVEWIKFYFVDFITKMWMVTFSLHLVVTTCNKNELGKWDSW